MILYISSVWVSHAAEIETAIPAYSVAYMVVSDVPGIWDALEASSSWQAFLSSEERANTRFAPTSAQDIKSRMRRLKELLGVDLRTLLEVFGHRVAFVQIFVDAEGPSLPVIIADVTNSGGASEMISKIEGELGRNEEYEVQPNAGTYVTVPFGLARRRAEEFTVRYAFLDNLFVLAPGRDTFEAVVDTYLGGGSSLIYDPKFNRTRAEGIEADGHVFAYVNLEILWPMIWEVCDSELRAVLQMSGVYEVRSIAWTADLLAPTRDQEIYMYTGDGRGLLASLFAQPKALFSPHLIPASDADMFFAAHLGDPIVAWEKIKDAVRSVAGEEGYAQMQSDISRFERETGLGLKDDILSALTGEIGFAMPLVRTWGTAPVVMPVRGPESLLEDGLMMFCGVKDRERCAMSIERILSAADIQLEHMEYRGVKVYQIHALSSSEVPVGYMFAGELLIFGSFQRLSQVLMDEEPPLVVSEKFAQINSQLPHVETRHAVSLLCYVDLGKAEELLLRASPEIQSEGDMARLQTLGSIGGTLIHDGEGLKVRSIGTPGRSWLETIGRLANLMSNE